MQPNFESELRKNLDNFRNDKIDYVHEYRNAGPMQPGLTPREASDKLILFQVYSQILEIHNQANSLFSSESIRRSLASSPNLPEWRGAIWFTTNRLSRIRSDPQRTQSFTKVVQTV